MTHPQNVHATVHLNEQTQQAFRPGSLGRNRFGIVTGYSLIEIMDNVWLEPINTRGHTTRGCRIEVPADPDTLRELAGKLSEAADQIESRSAQAA